TQAVADIVVARMRTAEGALRAAPRPHFVVPPAAPAPPTAMHELRDLLAEIIATTVSIACMPGLLSDASRELGRIAAAASHGAGLVRGLFEAAGSEAQRKGDALPAAHPYACTDDDDTGEHTPLPHKGG